jgi:hypothetical protein
MKLMKLSTIVIGLLAIYPHVNSAAEERQPEGTKFTGPNEESFEPPSINPNEGGNAGENPRRPHPHVPDCFVTDVCERIENEYKNVHYLYPSLRTEFCDAECCFLQGVHCKDKSEKYDWERMSGFVKFLFEEADVETFDTIEVDDDIIESWIIVFQSTAPILLGLIPLTMRQYGRMSMGIGYATTLAVMIVSISFTENWYMNVLNLILCLSSIYMERGSYDYAYIISNYIGTFAILGSLFFFSPPVQVAIMITIFSSYCWLLYELFFKKKSSSSATLLVVVALLLLMGERINFIRNQMMLRGSVDCFVELLLNSILPRGRSHYGWKNFIRLTRLFCNTLTWYPRNLQVIGIAIFIGQILMFLAFRTFLGSFYVLQLRFKLDADNILQCLNLYNVTVFNCVWVLLRNILQVDKNDPRRWFYSIFGVALLVSEFTYCFEYFVWRVISWFWDIVFNDGKATSINKYLTNPVNMAWMRYPQIGSIPPYD